jgi:hydroxylamine dehydrogenase
MKPMCHVATLFCLAAIRAAAGSFAAESPPLSESTETCLTCHELVTPGIVADWRKSLHAKVTPAEALKKKPQSRRMSAKEVSDDYADVVVGCAECHGLRPEKHEDTFEHAESKVHVVVTPDDCATCHPVEARQYSGNLMSRAYGNLRNNPLYHDLTDAINGGVSFKDSKLVATSPDAETESDSCLYCHGTAVKVEGTATQETELGEMDFPVLSGWPNHGVGRLNPDGSMGSCTPCHTRHQFSIEMARKPHTCSECHQGPDVPAYKVYMVSKHGNLFSSMGHQWNYDHVPWVLGNDFTSPTCAVCHASMIVKEDGELVAERTHQMNDRQPWRIFGPIYAHPHPKDPDTSLIKNEAGLPLPTELTGQPAAAFLIDSKEQARRRESMENVCLGCHGTGWVRGHFTRFENTIRTTNAMTLTATEILLKAWEVGAASGPAQGDSIFNETIEKQWVENWLFFANSTRFASAMSGADYGVFANGRWYLSKNIREMADWLKRELEARQRNAGKETDSEGE